MVSAWKKSELDEKGGEGRVGQGCLRKLPLHGERKPAIQRARKSTKDRRNRQYQGPKVEGD